MATKNAIVANSKTPDVSAEITQAGELMLSFLSGRSVTITPSKLDDSIRQQATLHGLKQKLVDAAAIARSLVTGKSATPYDKEVAVMEVFNRITRTDGTATWNKVREAGATAVGGLLVAALMELTGKDKPAILEYLEKKTNEEKAALRKNQKVAEIILRMQAATVNPDIDTEELLADLMEYEPGEEDGDDDADNSTDGDDIDDGEGADQTAIALM